MSPQTLSIPESPRPDHVFSTEASDVFSVLGEANMFSALADFGSDGNEVDFMMSSMDSPFGVPIMDGHTMTESLDLLKTLSAQPASQTGLSGPEPQDTPDALIYGSSHSILTKNKQSIEAVSEWLTCTNCAGDNFLLAVLSMTVLKILERYAAAARPSDSEAEKASRLANGILASSKDQMMVLGHTYNTPRSRGRKAAQLVLSELHRVQRLVNQLSPKLKRPKDAERRNLDPDLELWGRRDVSCGYDPGPTAPFSAFTLGQMESDVRKSLAALSSEIINGLRQS
ncbi:hypothetical protein SLS63_006045 [Diaporthe eres]|uniref:Aflatoxin regulatory protein domain-containing protein n=1 Tax=Diaporthe eres TaxID=83184 RepID=A0ABR1P8X2_DIAER